MSVNKVKLSTGETLIDLTGDSVAPETLAEGETAHDASGNLITGTMPIDVVRYGSQTLTEGQKAQARKNIDAASNVIYRATDYGISTEAEDNAVALQTLIDNVSASGGGIIFFPIGTYKFMRWNTSGWRVIEMKSNVSIVGENMEKTVLKLTQEGAYPLFARLPESGASADNPLTGCTFQNFTVDAYATGDVNNVQGKAFFFQYVRDCVFRDLRLMGTIATALGIDFLDRVVIDNVSCIDCGRTFTGTEAGTSGIGIGTAGWENENFIITNCICNRSGQYGIFIENQGIFGDSNVAYAKGCIISNCIVRNGINKGIGVRGGQNVTVIGCESYENASHGIFIDNNCKNVKVISCSGANNGGAGIFITPNNTEHLLVKGCTFVKNQAEGIKVSTDASKSINKLCIQDCYTDGNFVGIDLSAKYLVDCVILGNATLDGVNNGVTFTGNTVFNDIINTAESITPPIKPESYKNCIDTEGNSLNPVFVNGIYWVEEDGKVKMPADHISSFLLFDTPLITKRIEATINNMTLSGSRDDRNGIVFALTDHGGDSSFDMSTDDVSYYWAFVSGANNLELVEMGAYQNWKWFATVSLSSLGIDVAKDGITLAAEWDANGNIKVFANGTLAIEAKDESPLTGDLYGVLTRRWGNTQTPNTYTDAVASFVTGGESTLDEVDVAISVPYSSMTNGKKLMPDGSFTDGTLGATHATEEYIDVSVLNDTFGLFYPATSSGPIRIAQYDSNKNSLGDSFGLNQATETTDEYKVWEVNKLEGCRYIRIFLSGGFGGLDGELRNIDK